VFAGQNFTLVEGMVSTQGQADVAELYGSAGNDTFRAQPYSIPLVYMWRPAAGAIPAIYTYATGFKTVKGFPAGGTDDQAYLFGTTGNDTLTADATQAEMTGTALFGGNPATYRYIAVNSAGTWDKVYAYGGGDTPPGYAGGNDTATLYGRATGTDTLWANATDAALTDGTLNLTTGALTAANTYYYRLRGFDAAADLLNVYGLAGTNNKKDNPHAYTLMLYDTWFGI
jgi:hypothetical protein